MRNTLRKILNTRRARPTQGVAVRPAAPPVRDCDDISQGEVEALRTLAVHSPDAVYVANTRGEILIANGTFSALLGMSSVEELLRIGAAKPNGMYVAPNRATVIYDEISRSDGTRRFVSQILTRGGDPLWIEESLRRYETSTGRFLLISTVREQRAPVASVARNDFRVAESRQAELRGAESRGLRETCDRCERILDLLEECKPTGNAMEYVRALRDQVRRISSGDETTEPGGVPLDRDALRRATAAEHDLAFSWLTDGESRTDSDAARSPALDPLTAIERIETLLGSLDDAESLSISKLCNAEQPTVALPEGIASNRPFDLAILARRCLGDQSLMRDLLANFTEACRDELDKLVAAIAGRESYAACRAAMRLRGSSAAIAAETLSARFAAVELACQTRGWDVAETLLLESRRELAVCHEFARSYAGRDDAAPPPCEVSPEVSEPGKPAREMLLEVR